MQFMKLNALLMYFTQTFTVLEQKSVNLSFKNFKFNTKNEK